MTKLFDRKPRRVTLFAGHYGSGKTTAAVNFALWLKAQGHDTAIADLDIVNPYFRTRDSLDELNAADVRLIASPFAGSNVDAPALPGEAYAVVEDTSLHAVIDVGGDDRGALALGRYVPYLREENDYDFLCVINRFRPLTTTADDTIEVLREIETACKLPFTGICACSNLGDLTSAEDILASEAYTQEVAEKMGLPIVMTCVPEHLIHQLEGMENIFPIRHRTKFI